MRRAALCLLILISLCSGCSGRTESAPEPAPVIGYPARCARPAKPDLPKLAGLPLLESREGYARLKLRDQRLRAYVAALQDALNCYEAQAVATKEAADCDSSDAQLPSKQEAR